MLIRQGPLTFQGLNKKGALIEEGALNRRRAHSNGSTSKPHVVLDVLYTADYEFQDVYQSLIITERGEVHEADQEVVHSPYWYTSSPYRPGVVDNQATIMAG